VAALVELTRVRGMTSGELVAAQFTNVAIRVPSVRPFAVRQVRMRCCCCCLFVCLFVLVFFLSQLKRGVEALLCSQSMPHCLHKFC
jgi:hypothetical protein